MKWFINAVLYSAKGGFITKEGYYNGTKAEAIETIYSELRAAALAKFGTIDGNYKIEFCYEAKQLLKAGADNLRTCIFRMCAN